MVVAEGGSLSSSLPSRPRPMRDLSNTVSCPDVLLASHPTQSRVVTKSRRLSSKKVAEVSSKRAFLKPKEGDGLKTAFYRLGMDLQKQTTTPRERSASMEGYANDETPSGDPFLLRRPRSETTISVESPETIAELEPPLHDDGGDHPQRKLEVHLEKEASFDTAEATTNAEDATTEAKAPIASGAAGHTTRGGCFYAVVLGGLFACVGIQAAAWRHQSLDSTGYSAASSPRPSFDLSDVPPPEAFPEPLFLSPSPIG